MNVKMILNREIERNIWVYYGYKMEIYTQWYWKSKNQIAQYDFSLLIFLVQCFDENSQQQMVYRKFSNQPIFFVIHQLKPDKFQENQILFEKNFLSSSNQKVILLLEDYLNFQIYILKSAFINICNSKAFLSQKDVDCDHILSDFTRDFLYQFKQVALPALKKKLQEKLLNVQINIEDYVKDLAIFDDQTKNFKLSMEQSKKANVDAYGYFNDQTQSSDYYSNLFYSKESFDLTLGNKQDSEISEKDQNILISVYHNSINLVLLVIFNQEFCTKNTNLLRSSVRLFYEFLKIQNLEIKNSFLKLVDQLQLKQCFMNIEKNNPQLKQSASNISDILQNGFQKQPIEQNIDQNINQINQIQSMQIIEENSSKSTKTQLQIAQKKEQIRLQFLNKQSQFSNKNSKQLDSIQESNKDETQYCVICKDENNKKKPFGMTIYLSQSNFRSYTEQNFRSQHQIISEYDQQEYESSLMISTCKHQIHQSCFQTYIQKKIYGYDKKDIRCPLCNQLCNMLMIMEIQQKQSAQDQENEMEINENLLLKYIFEDNQEDKSQKIQQIDKEKNNNDFMEEMENQKEKKIKFDEDDKNSNFSEFFDQILQYYILNTVPYEMQDDVILDITEKLIMNYFYQIDDTSLKEVIKKGIEIHHEVYHKFKKFFIKHESVTKQNFLNMRKKFIQQICSNLINNQEQQEILILANLDELLVKTLVYMTYFIQNLKELQKISKNVFQYFIIIKILQYFSSINLTESTEYFQISQNSQTLIILLSKLPETSFQAFRGIVEKFYLFDQLINGYQQSQQEIQILSDMNQFQSMIFLLSKIKLSVNILEHFSVQNKNLFYQHWNRYIINKKYLVQSQTIQLIKIRQHKDMIKPSLIPLPHSYADLSLAYMNRKCTICQDFSKMGSLSICLICGVTICTRQCKQGPKRIGNLNEHAKKYHAYNAVFLVLTSTEIIWVSHPQNYLDTPLYQDQYGQEFKIKSENWSCFQVDKKKIDKILDVLLKGQVMQEINQLVTKTSMAYHEQIY